MWVYKVVVQRNPGSDADRQFQLVVFDRLLGAFRKDGHVLGRELTTVSTDRGLEAYLLVPGRDAFEEKFQNKWIARAIEELTATGLSGLEFIELGKEPTEPDSCACPEPSSYILFISYGELQSPVRCGDCFCPIPLYRLPRFESGEFVEVVSWMEDYKSCDSLFMNSSTGERFGYREMSQVKSSLSRRGREICEYIERKTGINTYYFLQRYYGRSRASEKSRKCPVCAGEWRLPERLHHLIDFKCHGCRLVSCLSSAV